MHWNKDAPHLIELLIICIGIPAACVLGWARVSLGPAHGSSFADTRAAVSRPGLPSRSSGIGKGGVKTIQDKGRTAYLTFDGGPSAYTPRLLTELRAAGVKATFFVTFKGVDSAQKRAWLREEAEAGEALGVRSWTDDSRRIYASPQAFAEDYARMRQVIVEATGVVPHVCRFPGGTAGSLSASYGGMSTPRLNAIAQGMGLKPYGWNAGGEDTAASVAAAALAQQVLRDANGKPAAVILLHDTDAASVDAVPAIIAGLRSQGCRFGVLAPAAPSLQRHEAAKSSPVRKITA